MSLPTHPPTTITTDRLGCRSVLEGLEQKLSPLRRSNPRAKREKVWMEILTREPAYFKRLLRALDLGTCLPARLPASRV